MTVASTSTTDYSLAVGGLVVGALLLHPFAMAAANPAMSGRLGAWTTAFGQTLVPSMWPMALTFSLLGLGLGLLFQRLCRVGLAPDSLFGEGEQFLRICMYCKAMPQKGPDGKEHWLPLEQVLYDHRPTGGGLRFSHGVCPRCQEEILEPELRAFKNQRRGRAHTTSSAVVT